MMYELGARQIGTSWIVPLSTAMSLMHSTRLYYIMFNEDIRSSHYIQLIFILLNTRVKCMFTVLGT